MVTGHASHQIGLDADIWFTPMPGHRLNTEERDNLPADSIVAADGNDVDRAVWGPQYRKLIEAVAQLPELARMFVNPAIKRELCREAGTDRDWLARTRVSIAIWRSKKAGMYRPEAAIVWARAALEKRSVAATAATTRLG